MDNKERMEREKCKVETFYFSLRFLISYDFKVVNVNLFLIFHAECWKLSISVWKEVVFERRFQSNKELQYRDEDKLFSNNV
jgi:hypothetical protein